jgi:phosphomannomutase
MPIGGIMSFKIQFGTDGWRGVIAEDYTFDNVRRCTQGFAKYLLNHTVSKLWIVVGYDKRFHSENFALAAAEVLTGNGIGVYLTDGPTPTPIIAFSVVEKHADGAVNITASHNPATDNGYKVRDRNGGAIAPEGLLEIERLIPESIEDVKRVPAQVAIENGQLIRFDPSQKYIDHLKHLIDVQPIIDAGLNVVVDAMWGNGAGWFPRLLGGGKTKITEIHNIQK